MESYDLVMMAVLAGATLFGAWKGMAWQVASLASLVASYFVSLSFSPQVAPLIGDQEPWNRFVAMLVLYAGTSLVIWLLFRVVGGIIDSLKLKEFDRQLGALFGLAKGILLCVVITLFAVSLLPPEQKQNILKSRSGHYVAMFLDRSRSIMPEEMGHVLAPYLDKAERTLHPEADDLGTAIDPSRISVQPAEKTRR